MNGYVYIMYIYTDRIRKGCVHEQMTDRLVDSWLNVGGVEGEDADGDEGKSGGQGQGKRDVCRVRATVNDQIQDACDSGSEGKG